MAQGESVIVIGVNSEAYPFNLDFKTVISYCVRHGRSSVKLFLMSKYGRN